MSACKLPYWHERNVSSVKPLAHVVATSWNNQQNYDAWLSRNGDEPERRVLVTLDLRNSRALLQLSARRKLDEEKEPQRSRPLGDQLVITVAIDRRLNVNRIARTWYQRRWKLRHSDATNKGLIFPSTGSLPMHVRVGWMRMQIGRKTKSLARNSQGNTGVRHAGRSVNNHPRARANSFKY